jgi:ABC-type lipoprotein release transport system permease subunit
MRAHRLLFRSLAFHARSHLGVVLGTAVATAVLVGAFAVGDSLQASLRQRALSRLGKIHAAYDGRDRFFESDPGGPARAPGAPQDVPDAAGMVRANILRLPGLVARQDGTARANRIQVLGVDAAFLALATSPVRETPAAGEVWVNQALATQLATKAGETLVFRLHKPGALSLDAIVSPRDDASIALRLVVSRILSDAELGGFNLGVGQESALNAFVRLESLQAATSLQGRANVYLVGGTPVGQDEKPIRNFVASTEQDIHDHATIEDLEYTVRPLRPGAVESGGEAPPASIEFATRRIFIEPPAESAGVVGSKGDLWGPPVPISTYLVNQLAANGRFAPYSMVTAAGAPFTPRDMADDEILINQWLADDLRIGPGDRLMMTHYDADSASSLVERTNYFRVRAIVPMKGLWADRTLMPEFPGLAKAESTHDWDAGFTLVHKIRDQDEAYWKQWRGTPKAFITERAGRRLWTNRFGSLTSVRYLQDDPQRIDERVAALRRIIRQGLDPKVFGLALRPVREEALLAARSGTAQIFAGLFIGFSLFIIFSALLLTSLLFRFGLEQRAGEVGILLALGWSRGRVRGLHLREGAILAVLGAIPGTWLGTLYARGFLWGLNHVWSDAVAGTALHYSATVAALFGGSIGGIIIAVLTLALALRHLARRPARELLNEGAVEAPEGILGSQPARWKRFIPVAAVLAAIGLGFAGTRLPAHQQPATFFGVGALLLTAGILALRRRFLAPVPRTDGLSRSAFTWRAPSRQPTRSAATVTLLASATFIVVAVAAFRIEGRLDADRRAGGAGGFAFWGESALPILKDLNTEAGLEAYNLAPSQVEGASFVGLRLRDGDDASCLNLSLTTRPRILGLDPRAFASRGAFSFAGLAKDLSVTNGWMALERRADDKTVPAIADVASLQWALKKKVGDTLELQDGQGKPFQVRIVGAVAQGMLQGNLIIDEREFSRLFPAESGYRVLLVDAPAARRDLIRANLSRALEDTGLSLTPTVDRLNRFNAVQNTYIGTFQVLGGLGLLLGSIGLGIVVLRNVHERRGEIAIFRAVGFDSGTVRSLILREHVVLVVLGLGLGCLSAAIAVAPMLTNGTGLPWSTLVPTLAAVALNGLFFTWIATRHACRGVVIDALRGE